MDAAGEQQWRVVWFPPDKPKMTKILATEQAATEWYDAVAQAGHAPMMETRTLPEWEVTANSVRDHLQAALIGTGARKSTPPPQPPLTEVETRLEKCPCSEGGLHKFGLRGGPGIEGNRRCNGCDKTAGMLLTDRTPQ